MSKGNWTPGPWFTNSFSTGTEEGVEILEKSGGTGFSRLVLEIITRHGTKRRQEFARAEANAARIVACVNACEGINPEHLPELLKAIQFTISYCADSGNWFPGIKEVRDALAKAEGR